VTGPTARDEVSNLAIDSTFLYYIVAGSSLYGYEDAAYTLNAGPIGGGSPVTLATDVSGPVENLFVYGANLYWAIPSLEGGDGAQSTPAALMTVPVHGGPPTTVFPTCPTKRHSPS
jgi:hypothetical protein